MRIGFVVNDVKTEYPGYTTTLLARAACKLGHEIWYTGVGDFSLKPNDHTYARARTLPARHYPTGEAFLAELSSDESTEQHICVDQLDVLLLRNDANQHALQRPWARLAGINFGFLAQRAGVLVLNEPGTLARSLSKLYLQYFPKTIRPQTLITRNQKEAHNFIAKLIPARRAQGRWRAS